MSAWDLLLQLALSVPGRRRSPCEENLVLGAYRDGGRRTIVRERLAAVHALFPVLRDRARQIASTLSGREQQMVAIGRALMAGPGLLLLADELLGDEAVRKAHLG